MSVIHNPHDAFFKTAMANIIVAREFIEQHLPEKYKHMLDLNSLELDPSTFVSPKLQKTASDILYKVNFLNEHQFAYIYILAEHQSSVDNLMPFRLWQYIVSIWNECVKKQEGNLKNLKLPLVIPLVFYNGPNKYTGPKNIRELIDAPPDLIEQFLFKSFQLIDTHDIADEELQQKHWAGLMQFVMKHAFAREALNYIQDFLKLIRQMDSIEGCDNYLGSVLEYFCSQVQSEDLSKLSKTLQDGLSKTKKGVIMATLENYWIEKGLEKGVVLGMEKGEVLGLQKGEVLGMQKGEALLLIHLLERKFGTIPKHYLAKIQEAESHILLEWADKILEANHLQMIFEN